jgi:hypothetical protein
MNKILMMLLTILILATLTACGRDADKSGDSGKFDQYRAGEYVEIMESGTYYIDSISYILGSGTTIKMAVDGNSSSVEIGGVNLPFRILTLNDTFYYINDDEKKITAVESNLDEDVARAGVFNYTGITFSTNGNGAIPDLAGIDDNVYDYEEFTVGTGDNMDLIRYYFKGDNLYAIRTKMTGVYLTMVIKELSKDIPEGLLELPSGYKVVDAMGFFN